MDNSAIVFESKALASGDFEKAWQIHSGELEAVCAIPTQFKGMGGGFSPEDLFLQALINCFIGTFKVYAKASALDFSNLEVNGSLTVDKDESKKTIMKSCKLNIEMSGVEKPDRVETLVAKVFRDGFILNSVKTQINYHLRIDGVTSERNLISKSL